jgi:hypothetical protein
VRFVVDHRLGPIRRRVTAKALWQLTGSRYRLPLLAFGVLRGRLERIASAKYDVGLIDHDGCDFADIASATCIDFICIFANNCNLTRG